MTGLALADSFTPLQTLSAIQEHFSREAEKSEHTLQHQKKVSQFILDLSTVSEVKVAREISQLLTCLLFLIQFMTQERESRETKHYEHEVQLQSVIHQISNLPSDLLAQLEMASSGMARGEEYHQEPQQDVEPSPSIGPDVDPEPTPVLAEGGTAAEGIPHELNPDRSRTLPAGPGLAKAYQSIVNLERKFSGISTSEDAAKGKGSIGKKLKGPRGPLTIAGQRIWGAFPFALVLDLREADLGLG